MRVVGKVDAQPRGKAGGVGFGLRGKGGEGQPLGGHNLGGVGGDGEGQRGLGGEDINQFVFDQGVADLGAVFDLTDGGEGEAGDAKLFGEAAGGAVDRGFAPVRVGAAGVRP